uniref:3-hydroxyacyl-CoA dehydrogenase NAD binding domain-containing protein n=1 Tax=Ciona savignyi TaxID=51511 RepID=H2Y7D3_CIOSA
MSIICGSEYADISEEKLRNWSLSAKDGGASIKPMLVSKAAVIGLGTMGRGIAISLLRAGKHVLVFEMNKAALEAGVKALHFILDRLFLRKIINEDEMLKMKSFIQPSHNYEDLHEVDLVIEAVFEELKLKTTIFSKLDKVCKPTAILASNTSALDIDDIAYATSRPGKVIGMHFFAPAHLMRLLENVRGTRSSPETIVTAMDLGKQMNKVTVLVGNCEGFVGNRMYFHYMQQADFLLEEGAYPHQVDKVLTDYGFAMGRYEVGDLSGNDVGYRVRAKQGLTPRQQPNGAPERSRNGVRYCPLSDYLVESGRHGQKTNGKGWYKYVPGNRAPQVDSDVIKLIDDYRKRFHIQPRNIHLRK